MSDILKKTLGELMDILSEPNPRRRKKLLLEASKREDMIRTIIELSTNTVQESLPLTKSGKERLAKRTKDVKCLMKCCDIKEPGKEASKIIAQSGGWLQIVAPAAISFLLDRLIK